MSGLVHATRGFRSLKSWRVLMLVGVAAIGLVQLGALARKPGTGQVAGPADCAAWDREASQGIAALISDNSPAAELRLDEAIQQLRRARRNCRAGSVAVAGHDYASLRRSFPITSGSVKVHAQRGE
jgi:hypothetical protein